MAYSIIETCIGCTACTKKCPVEAITGIRNELHVIDEELCIDCGACGAVCPPEAILDEMGDLARTFPPPRASSVEGRRVQLHRFRLRTLHQHLPVRRALPERRAELA